MATVLTQDMVLEKARAAAPLAVSKVLLWGLGLEDISCLGLFPGLRVVSLTDNRVSSLQVFSGLARLEELYLRRNRIAALAELDALAGLRFLRRVWVSENPFCLGLQDYRGAVLARVPQIAMLDEALVTPEERARAARGAQAWPEARADPESRSGQKPVFQNAGRNFLEELKLDFGPDSPAPPGPNKWHAPERRPPFAKPPAQPRPPQTRPAHPGPAEASEPGDALDAFRPPVRPGAGARRPEPRAPTPTRQPRGVGRAPEPVFWAEQDGEAGEGPDSEHLALFYSSMAPQRPKEQSSRKAPGTPR